MASRGAVLLAVAAAVAVMFASVASAQVDGGVPPAPAPVTGAAAGARRRRRWPWRALPCCPSSSRVGSCTRQAREVVMDGIGSLMISDLDTARFESFPAIE
uniref:Uncharacterized protein n=1 Tax=Oryza barthii TaxID=65489 RepID=A0A0D3F9R5_9ORYZ